MHRKHNSTNKRGSFSGALNDRLVYLAIVMLYAYGTSIASATPLSFTLFNVSSSNQSRLEMVAAAQLSGSDLTSEPQYAPGGLNGAGSLSTLYNDTAANDSNVTADVTQHTISFPGGSTAVAATRVGYSAIWQCRRTWAEPRELLPRIMV